MSPVPPTAAPAMDSHRSACARAALVWLAPLLVGKRVALLGEFDASLPIRLGAAEVLALHAGPALRPADPVEGVRHRSLLGGVIAADDESVDVIIVDDPGDLIRRATLLEELERIRAESGLLIWLTAAREGTGRGMAYERLATRLRAFGDVRIFGQSLLSAMSCVEIGDEVIDSIEVDTTLLADTAAAGVHTILGYVAIAGRIVAHDGLATNLCLIVDRHVDLPSLTEVLAAGFDQSSEALLVEQRLEALPPASDHAVADDAEVKAAVSASAAAAIASAGARLEEEHPASDAGWAAPPSAMDLSALDVDWDPAADAEIAATAAAAMHTADNKLARIEHDLMRSVERAEIAEAMHLDVLANREQERTVFEKALISVEAQRDELARLLEESEEARAILEQKLASLEGERLESAGFDTPHQTKISAVPELLAMVERGGDVEGEREREVGPRLHTAEQRVSRLARIVDELAAGLDELSTEGRGDRPASFAPVARARELAIDLGVRDAELALLTMGLAALQDRVHNAVVDVKNLAERAQTQDLEPLRSAVRELAGRVGSLEGV